MRYIYMSLKLSFDLDLFRVVPYRVYSMAPGKRKMPGGAEQYRRVRAV